MSWESYAVGALLGALNWQFDVGALLGGLTAAAATGFGFFYASRQIKQSASEQASAERWRRLEFTTRLMDRWSSDEELVFCAKALDWGVGELVIPTKHRVWFPPGTVKFTHDWDSLVRAVKPGLARDWSRPEMLTYRHCFDAFFTYFEYLNNIRATGVIEDRYLVGLYYYVELVRRPKYSKWESSGRAIFKPFVDKYYPPELSQYFWPPEAAKPQDPLPNP